MGTRFTHSLSDPTLAVLEVSQGNFSNSGHRCLIVSSISLQLTIFLKFHLLPRINKTSLTLDCAFYLLNQQRTTFTFSVSVILAIDVPAPASPSTAYGGNNTSCRKLQEIANSLKELTKTSETRLWSEYPLTSSLLCKKNLKAAALTIKGHVLYEPHVKRQILCEIHKVQHFILVEASHHHTVHLQVKQTPETSEQSMTCTPSCTRT